MRITLAEALLRRKELNNKVLQLQQIDPKSLWEVKYQRKQVNENVDDLTMHIPKLKPEEFTMAYDYHARNLRLIDAAIQQANWTTNIEVQDSTMTDFKTQDKK